MNKFEEFVSSADRRKREYQIAVTSYTQNTKRVHNQESHRINCIFVEMLAFLMEKEPQSNFAFQMEFVILS